MVRPRRIILAFSVLVTVVLLFLSTFWCILVDKEVPWVAKVSLLGYHFKSPPIPDLSPQVIDGIKKFVFFVGYPRSGHSIVGALIDAHPHVVIPHEYFLFSHFADLNKTSDDAWRDNLFNLLYKKSDVDVDKIRAEAWKGYKLGVDGLWQGRFDEHIEAIGDKSGGVTTEEYMLDKIGFIRNYHTLKRHVSVPVLVIHVLRNPFDMVSTNLAYNHSEIWRLRKIKEELGYLPKKSEEDGEVVERFDLPDLVDEQITFFLDHFDAVTEMIRDVFDEGSVLEIHNCDLVAYPKRTLLKIFRFLEVETTENYLEAFAQKVFKTVSRSRHAVTWHPEQRLRLEREMRKYRMLDRYNFTSD